jgi:SEL1 protein
LYENALDVLGKRRWAVVYPSDIRAAYADLEEAGKLGHRDAQKILGKDFVEITFNLFALAFSYLFGENRWSIDEAREIFERLAKDGSPDANLGLGFIYSTGLGLEHPDPARGLLHYTFSALGGNPLAQMAVVSSIYCVTKYLFVSRHTATMPESMLLKAVTLHWLGIEELRVKLLTMSS